MSKRKRIYRPNQKALDKPRYLILNGKLVGIGGEITLPAVPPAVPKMIPEATQQEYNELGEKGTVAHLLTEQGETENEDDKPKRDAETEKPFTGIFNRRSKPS